MQTDGWTNGQTDITKLIITFRNFANAPEKESTLKWLENLIFHLKDTHHPIHITHFLEETNRIEF